MKNSIIKTFGLIITLLLIGIFAFDINAKTLNTPTITNLKKDSRENNALKIEFTSNNSGSNYSYELVNTNTNKKNTVAGSAEFYVFQNLVANTSYKVKLRVCSLVSNSYICSNWVNANASTSGSNVLSTPVLTSLVALSSSSIKLNYIASGNISGVEILNVTGNKPIKTTNVKTFKVTNLKANTMYKFKIRSYYSNDGKTTYSGYSSEKSIKTSKEQVKKEEKKKSIIVKKPTLSSVKENSTSNYYKYKTSSTSAILKYKTSGNVTGIQIYNITNKKIKNTSNKSSYSFKNLKRGKTYKFKIRSYYKFGGKTYYSRYTSSKSVKIEKVSGSELIARTAEELAWDKGTSSSIYHHNYDKHKKFTSWKQLGKSRPTNNFMNAYDKVRKGHWEIGGSKWGYWTRIGASCDVFVGTSIRYSGYDKQFPFGLGSNKSQQLGHMKSSSKWKKVSKEKRGDVCYRSGHVLIYLGNNKIAEAGYKTKRFGKIYKGSCSSRYTVYRATK